MRLDFILLLLFLLHPTSALAQPRPDPYSDSTTIPQTPAYGRAVELVELLNQDDPDALEAYARSTFTGPFLDEIPMAEHRQVFVEFHRDNGPVQVHGARTYDPPRPASMATLIVWSTWLESWRGIGVEVDGDGKITSLTLSPARPPSDLPKAEVLTDEQLAEGLAGFVDRRAARDAFSGTVLLAKDGQVLMTKAVGIANRDFDAPVTLDTRFNLGSMNKMLTAVACLQLGEAGEGLDEQPMPGLDSEALDFRAASESGLAAMAVPDRLHSYGA